MITAASRQTSTPDSEEEVPSVLVVDADGVSRRFVERTLGASGAMRVESARDGAAAFDILRNAVIDLIVAETVLPDLDGMQLLRRLAQETRLRQIPLIFLSADSKITTKVAALRSGAVDYLVKPVDAQELLARVQARLEQQRRARDVYLGRNYVLAGDFTGMPFPDLVNLLYLSRATGMLAVVTPRAAARLFFDGGQLVHAIFGNLYGELAFYRLLRETQGHFEFSPGAPELTPGEHTIQQSPTALLMEGTRILDTERATEGVAGRVDPLQIEQNPWALKTPLEALKPPPLPDVSLAAQLEAGLHDPYALGEMRLMSEPELAQWTRTELALRRVHVLLIADLAAGASALMTIAGPLAERDVLAGLSTLPKVLSLAFFMRHERMLDVVLLDVQRPAAFRRALLRTPDLIVLAPPTGDFLAISVEARAELDELLNRLRPAALLGVGNASLEAGWAELSSVQERRVRVQCVRGGVAAAGTDLRQLLVAGLRLWATGDANRSLQDGVE